MASMVSAKAPSGVIGMPLTGEAFNFNIMKEIKLTKGFITLVDDEDYQYLNQFKWHVLQPGISKYAARRINGVYYFMHRIIMKTPDSMQVDHIDHNGLNNQKSNMRNCTQHQNLMNTRKYTGRSKYLGVSFNKKYISAQISVNYKKIHLGYFMTEEAAARAYDEAAKRYFKQFANLNFKP